MLFIIINEIIKRSADRLHHQVEVRPPRHGGRAPILHEQQDLGLDLQTIAGVDKASIHGQVREECNGDGAADGEAADVIEDASQAAIRAAIPEGPRDLLAHEPADAEGPDVALPRRQMQALHSRVPIGQDKSHAAEEGVHDPLHQEEEAAVGQGGQGAGPGEAQAVAGEHEEVADAGSKRWVPNSLLGRDMLHEENLQRC